MSNPTNTGTVSPMPGGDTPTPNSEQVGSTQPKMLAQISQDLDLNVTKELHQWYAFHIARGTEIELKELFEAKTHKLIGVAIFVAGKEAFRLETANLTGCKYLAMAKYEGIVNGYNVAKLHGLTGGNTSGGLGLQRGRWAQADKVRAYNMHKDEGKSYQEIAQILNRPQGSVEDVIKEMAAPPAPPAEQAPPTEEVVASVEEPVGLPA